MHKANIICSLLLVTTVLHAQTFQQLNKLVASTRTSGILFGSSVAVSGNYAVIGASDLSDVQTPSSCNCVYIFEKNSSGQWLQIQKLTAPNTTARNGFGFSVSISGNYLVVGAPQEDRDASGNNSLIAAGAVYVFERNSTGTWAFTKKLVSINRGALHLFGYSVSISGTKLLVGAPTKGAAYLFERLDATNWKAWCEIVSPDQPGQARFGNSVAISGDNMVIGAPYANKDTSNITAMSPPGTGENQMDGAGAAYIYKGASGDWRNMFVHKIVNWDRATGDEFGWSVAINGSTLMVGAPFEDRDRNMRDTLFSAGSVHVFELMADNRWWWVEKLVASLRNTGDNFGSSVSFSGNTAIIGAPTADEPLNTSNFGAAYIFSRDRFKGEWYNQQIKIIAPDKGASDWLGYAVATDGNNIFVSAPFQDKDQNGLIVSDAGAVYVFQRDPCQATSSTISPTECKEYISPSQHYTWTVSGSYQDTILNKGGCDSVITINLTISSCNKSLVDSTKSNQPPFIISRNSSIRKSFLEINKIVANDRTHNDEFGTSVSISGNYAVLGVPRDDEGEKGDTLLGAGSAYIFHLDDDGKWKQLQKISAFDRMPDAAFGCAVAISGNYIVVGANRDNLGVNGVNGSYLGGSAYVYHLVSGTWYFQQKIVPHASSRTGQNFFGSAVAIDGNTIVVSAPDDISDSTDSPSSNTSSAGALFVYELSGDQWLETQKLAANDRHIGDKLGNAVSICGDNIIAGSWGNDYDASYGTRVEAAGAAYIFERRSGKWVQAQKIVPEDRSPFDEFGFSVGISGIYAVVGADNVTETEDENSTEYTGSAYIFQREGGGNWSQVYKINPPDRKAADRLGQAVGISGDYVIVSARDQETDSLGNIVPDQGAVYVYYLDKDGHWSQSNKLTPLYYHQYEHFGHAVAISNCSLIVSSLSDQTDQADQNELPGAGAAFVFAPKDCNNNGSCNEGFMHGLKSIDSVITDSSKIRKFQSPDLNAKGNDIPIENLVLNDTGLVKPRNIKNIRQQKVDSIKPEKIQNIRQPKIDSVKSVRSNFDPSKVEICADILSQNTLPPKSEVIFYLPPSIKADGTLGEIASIKQSLSAVTANMWSPGDVLKVGFKPDPDHKEYFDKIEKYAKYWEGIANIKFSFVDVKDAQIIIKFEPSSATSWSKLGRDILFNPFGDATMNFGTFGMPVTDTNKLRGIVLHEFGHAIGFIHEHQSPTSGISWNKPNVYAFFTMPPLSWSRAMVDQQIFAKYSKTITNSSVYDKFSVMHYFYPKSLTTDSTEFKQNRRFSPIDSFFARSVYPFPPTPQNATGTLHTKDDCDAIDFNVEYNVVDTNVIEFILQPGRDPMNKQITWWKKIGIPLKGGVEEVLETENGSVTDKKIPVSIIENVRNLTFWKAKFLGVHTLLTYQWNVLPALVGGCRVTLVWKQDVCY